MADNGRYNRLYNSVADNPVWTQLSPAVFKVFAGCLMKANYRDSKWYDGSREVTIRRGSFVTSRDKMAEFCHVTPQQARDALRHMTKLGIITSTGTSKFTIVSFCNYDQYNANSDALEPAAEPTENQVGTRSEPSENQVGTTVTAVITTTAVKNTSSAANASETKFESKQRREPTELDRTISEIVPRMVERHLPKRRCSSTVVEMKLRAIAKSLPPIDRLHEIREIDRRHAGWCASHDWTKEGGQYWKGLKAWLNPSEGLWRLEPPTPDEYSLAQPRAPAHVVRKEAESQSLFEMASRRERGAGN